MKNTLRRAAARRAAVFGAAVLGALAASAELPYVPPFSAETAVSPETAIIGWPEDSQIAARVMITKYGEPRRVDEERLVWSDNGPWSKIVVYRDAPRGIFRRHGKDVVEQSIWYDVPDDKIPELRRFDPRLAVDKSTGELSSRAESEGLNFLALNLADEIVTGKMTSAEARDFYRVTVEFSESGKSSAYMNGILFSLHIPSPTP